MGKGVSFRFPLISFGTKAAGLKICASPAQQDMSQFIRRVIHLQRSSFSSWILWEKSKARQNWPRYSLRIIPFGERGDISEAVQRPGNAANHHGLSPHWRWTGQQVHCHLGDFPEGHRFSTHREAEGDHLRPSSQHQWQNAVHSRRQTMVGHDPGQECPSAGKKRYKTEGRVK